MHSTTLVPVLCLLQCARAQLALSLTQKVVDAPITVADGNTSSLDRRQVEVTATNRWNSYTAEVGVGNPPTTYTLMLDNGSANTWVRDYTRTKSSFAQPNAVAAVSYSLGSFGGQQYYDELVFGETTLVNQSITRATTSSGFGDVDGLLAFGPTDLSEDTVSGVNSVPTFVDNLYTQGLIPKRVVGVSFNPVTSVTNAAGESNGELMLGGVDNTQFIGDLDCMPVTSRAPSNTYWGLDIQSISYGNTTSSVQLSSNPSLRSGIVDTGTTLIRVPSDAFGAYVAQLDGASINDAGFLTMPLSTATRLQNLTMTMTNVANENVDFIMTPSAQTFPPEVALRFGQGADGSIISVFSDMGSVNSGWDFTLGMMWLERWYSSYDSDNKQICFSETSYTYQRTSELTSFRKAKRAHSKRAESWVHGKRRLHALSKRRIG